MNFPEAQELAQSYVHECERQCGVPLKLLVDNTIEREFGWVFFYAVDVSRSNEIIAGNGPLIVDKRTGNLHACGSAYPEADYIEAYERTGSVDIIDA